MSVEKCKLAALKYVAAQLKTEGQVRDYLSRKEFNQEEIGQALEFLREYKYVDDEQYCIIYYKEACRKGKSRRRIEQELVAKKAPRSLIRDALDGFLSDENPDYEAIMDEILPEKERALKVGRKMLRIQLDSGREADKNFMAKVGRRLAGLGYESGAIYYVIGCLMKEREQKDYE